MWERRCGVTRSVLADVSRRELNYVLNISDVYRYVLVNNPKTGLTSMKQGLIELETADAPTAPQSPHDTRNDPFLRLTDLRTTAPLTHLIRRGFTFVTMVRNPFTRLLSGYRSTILRHEAVDDPRRERWLTALGLPRSRHTAVGFDEFVAIVVRQSDREMDPHWRTQTTQILHDHLPFDFIGRFETIDDDFRRLLGAIGVPAKITPAIRHRNPSGASVDLRDWYPDELAGQVRRRYRRDFEVFGYPSSLPNPSP